MLFSSLHFVTFFAVVFAVFWACAGRFRIRTLFLLLAGYYFYMSWSWWWGILLAAPTLLDYVLALSVSRAAGPRRRLLLAVGVTANLGMLATFKYANFFLENVAGSLRMLGLPVATVHLDIVLPVGISFYTFQGISYVVDVYRGRFPAVADLSSFALFRAFFPLLLAGPITRAGVLLPQILRRRAEYDDGAVLAGLAMVFRGLGKKILIADVLTVAAVDPVFAAPGAHGAAMNILAVYAYAMQIYCDFSGYSDVAIGVAKMLGFDLPANFDRPYRACGVREFWARWHISLSTWLRDYLYVPLGGNRHGTFTTCRNLGLTMVLGGLWHGAAWNFVLWGAFHGAWLIIDRLVGNRRLPEEYSPGGRWLRRVLTFHVVCLSWVLFRGTGPGAIAEMLGQIVTLAPGPVTIGGVEAFLLGAAYIAHFTNPALLRAAEARFVRLPAFAQAAIYAGLIVLFIAAGGAQAPFIYFQF